ncbi:MAG: patatin-like phospholipase family protein [Xanthobacteraceae bacterium]
MPGLTTEDVLREEARRIRNRDLKCPDDDLYQELAKLDSAALCLSGGGIRSAAFALGVVQALATHPRSKRAAPVAQADQSLLTNFHFLSTVSGGGYVGSWLSAWRLWEPQFSNIWKSLIKPKGDVSEGGSPVSWLRSYTNYLTPKIGTVSPDTWAPIALALRNFLLTSLVILPPFFALILLLKIVGVVSNWVILWGQPEYWTPAWSIGADGLLFYFKFWIEVLSGIGGAACLVVALAFTARNRPTYRIAAGSGPDERQFLRTTMLWSLLSAVLLVHWIASDLVGNLLLKCGPHTPQPISLFSLCSGHDLATAGGWNTPRYANIQYLKAGAALGAFLYAVAWVIVGRRKQKMIDFFAWTVSGAIYGILAAVGLYAYLIIPDEGVAGLPIQFFHLVFGVPWLLLSQIVAETIFIGGSSYEDGSEADREWLGRSSGWYLAVAISWLVLMFFVFFYQVLGNTFVLKDTLPGALNDVQKWIAALAGISALITGILGRSSLSAATPEQSGGGLYITSLILPVAATIFSVTLLIISSSFLDVLLFGNSKVLLGDRLGNELGTIGIVTRLLGGFVICAAVAAIASYFININRFSLHALYRNKLIRTFLGASRARNPDPFTGFDLNDNPAMHRLWSPVEPGNWRPFQVINIALNAVSTSHLALRERKAAPFTVSPLHSGSAIVGYRGTKYFGGADGISLGTAMAISGAAASPNIGYHSSPAITLLMTVFNVRLGWWFGNPGRSGDKTYRNEGPRFALFPIVEEALGLPTEVRKYVYLSDGRHFENLGLYEMVRRRCRFIVVSDASYDPDFKFEDLGNAVRKISVDLRIEIRFKGLDRLKPRPTDGSDAETDAEYHAMAEIDYMSADGADRNGLLLYIKAGYRGTESAGVQGYAKAHPDFPHQSTANQWFTASQFESYRALGFEITDAILSRAVLECEGAHVTNLKSILMILGRLSGLEGQRGT